MKKVKHQSKRKVEDILRTAEDHQIDTDNNFDEEVVDEINNEIGLSDEPVEETITEIIDVEIAVGPETMNDEEMTIIEHERESVIETEVDEAEKTGFWGMFKKQVIDEEVNVVSEPKKEIKEEKVSMSFNAKQTSYASDTTAVISATMVITGDIEIENALVISGKIIGNVNCKDTFESKNGGSIEGNLSALSAEFVGGSVKGNVVVEEKIVIDEESVIEGDVKAKDLVLSGKVVGEIKVANTVRLTSSAVVKGDLYAASISIESGTKLDGRFVVQD